MTKIAVYGTLRKGFNLNGHLSKSKYIGEFKVKGFDLYISDRIPVIKKGTGEIIVEVYEISEYLLDDLDIIEGINRGYYERKKIRIKNFDTYIYVGKSLSKNKDLIKIESGDYKEYYSNLYKSQII